ncbi:cyclic diguanylate phosphodiesterase, partial [Pseudoalteromonas sp. S201]
ENLLEMRRALFDAKYVVDIGFFKNNQLVCTTGSGVLKTPINDRTPDYIRNNLESNNDNNIRVRFEPKLKILLFEERIMQVVIVRQGNYNLIMDTA